ncbi:MAG TPA: SDR family NAD(P)-dependent oxidoreductase [Alphaproteobacteria bacterium]|jgi:NAD(P)-dependent dehydrogenase (short-subunit alcohol dehydrogenase family)
MAPDRPHSDATADLKPFTGQHAVVTGGGRGIGAAIAEHLAARGASLTLIGRSREPLEAHRARLAARYTVPVEAVTADVTDAARVAAGFAAAVKALGPVQILINNAGRGESVPLKRMDLAFLNRMLSINVASTFLCIQQVLPAMTEAGYGRIVNVASTAGLIGYRYVAAYVASKHAVVGLTKAMALELAKTGITVNAVCPSYVETDMTKDTVANIIAKTGKSEAEVRAELVQFNPQARMIAPAEVASVVSWLALPASHSITGLAIPVAGGEVM